MPTPTPYAHQELLTEVQEINAQVNDVYNGLYLASAMILGSIVIYILLRVFLSISVRQWGI